MLAKHYLLQKFIAALLICATIPAFGQVQLGSDILGENTQDAFGKVMALSSDGKRVVSGGPNNDGGGANAGHVRVHEYQTNTSSWVQVGSDIDGNASGQHAGTDVDISGDGKRVAVLIPYFVDGGYTTGAVKVYEESNGVWTQLGNVILGLAFGPSSAQLDYSVSISNDGKRVAVGSKQNKVKVFEENSGFWSQVGADITGSGIFGFSVALSSDGKRLAVGAPSNGSNGPASGQVRIFEETSGTWSQVGASINGSFASNQTGYAIDLSADGKRVAMGTPYFGSPTWNGRVRIFSEASGVWTQVGSDILGEYNDDQFGWSIDLSADGKRVIGGSIDNSDNGNNAGHARVFQENNGTWIQEGNDIDGNAVNGYAGHDVAISEDGHTVGLGAPGVNGIGQVRVFGIQVSPACIGTRAITRHYCQPRVSLFERTGVVHKNEVVLALNNQSIIPSGATCTAPPANWTHFNVRVELFAASGPMTTPIGQNFINNEPISSLYTLPGSSDLFFNLPGSAIPPMLIGTGSNIYRIRVTITGVNGTVVSLHNSQYTLSISPNQEYLCTTPSNGPGLSR